MEQKDYERIVDDLAQAIDTRRCVLFLGPGCSEAVELRSAFGIPTQRSIVCALAEELSDEQLVERIKHVCAECPECDYCLLPEVAAKYEKEYDRNELLAFIRKLLRRGRPREFHQQLWNLPFAAIYTINYDRLVEKSLEGSQRVVPVTSDEVFVTVSRLIAERKIVPYYKLHGCISTDDVVVTIDDHLRLRLSKDKSDLWRELRRDIRNKIFLFVGYALADTDVLEIIYSVHSSGHRPPRSYAVIEEPIPFQARHWFEKFNIRTVPRSTDEFFEDLVRHYRLLQAQRRRKSFATSLERRYPSIWESFERIVSDQSFSGLCLYGQASIPEEDIVVVDELSVIPSEMREGCTRRREGGEMVLSVFLSIAQLGADVYVDPWRFIRLLEEVARQLDDELGKAGLPAFQMLDKLQRHSGDTWRAEADRRVQEYWYDEFGEDRYRDVDNAVRHPTPEQEKVNREERERYLTGRASDWFFGKLGSALGDEYRLLIFITDFELIEADKVWFKLISQHFINKLCDHNVGLIITRRAPEELRMDRAFSAYTLDLITQFDLAKFIKGG